MSLYLYTRDLPGTTVCYGKCATAWPLCYYIKDKQPGDVAGQTAGTVWYVISPAGEEIMTAP